MMILMELFLLGFLIYRISCYLKHKQFNIWRETGIWVFFFYLVVVANVTLFKHGVFEFPIYLNQLWFRLNLIPLVETFRMLTDGWVVAYSWYQVIANILVFVPLGFLTPLLYKSLTKWWHILLVGFSGSLLIEVLQILTPRNIVDIDDIIFNTLGAMVGYIVYLVFIKIVKHFNLITSIKKFEIHLTKPALKVASIPFSIMFFMACLASGIDYYESTFSNDLSDEELVSVYFPYEGELISKQFENSRYILKDYGKYLDLTVYQQLPFNRIREQSALQWNPEYNEKNYNFGFINHESRAYNEAIFMMIGKNEEASLVKITYLDEEYIEELPLGNFFVLYPGYIIEDQEINKIYEGKKSKTFSVEFLNEDGEVIDSL